MGQLLRANEYRKDVASRMEQVPVPRYANRLTSPSQALYLFGT